MRSSLLTILFLAAVWPAPPAAADEAAALDAARSATLEWLALADAGRADATWDAAAPLFQAAVSREDWARSLGAARDPLGELRARQESSSGYSTTLPGVPDGEYVVLKFDSSFDNKARAVETVTAMKVPGGGWAVAGYFIR